MARFIVDESFNVALSLLIPETSEAYGVMVKTFPAINAGIRINGSFRTFGGTERDTNGLYSVEKTAVIVTWYRPDIRSDCRIGIPETGDVYEILGAPEDIGMRHQFIRMKVMQIEGGA